MNANVVITDVSLKPNPVYCGEQFIVSAKIEDVVFALESDGYFIMDNDGAFILAPDAKVVYLSTGIENEVIADATGDFIEIMEE